MFVTQVAVIVALALGHVAHAPVAALRQFQWFSHGLQWLGARAPEGAFWRQRHGIWLALLPPVLVLALLQFALWGRLLGLASLVLGVLVLAWTWGPRDLDRDVEAVADRLHVCQGHACRAVATHRRQRSRRRSRTPTWSSCSP